MRCLACNAELTDKEANKKYSNHEEITDPEAKYIGLCSYCLRDPDSDTELDLINSHVDT